MSNPLSPHYENPPVLEVILGIQFDRVPKFSNAHLGAFWSTLDPKAWPSVADAPPLPAQFEQFEHSTSWARGVRLQLSNDPTSRLLIKNAAGNHLIQLQNGRFHLNWMGSDGNAYPRFESVAKEFQRNWLQFQTFVERSELGRIQPNQWEVTYINHIRKGTVWRTPEQWNFFKPLASMPSIDNLVSAESFSGDWRFVIPPARGRLHIGWQHGRDEASGSNGEEMVVLTLTARGPMDSHEDHLRQIESSFDLGHMTIVNAFSNLMSEQANRFWGLKNATN